MRRHQRRGGRGRAGALFGRLVTERVARAVRRRRARGRLAPAHGAAAHGGGRGARGRRVRVGRRDRGGRHRRPRPDRLAARRAGGGQGVRLRAAPAPDPGRPPSGAHRRELRPWRGTALRLPRRQRRPHAARRGRGGRGLSRRGADDGRRRRRGLRQGRPAARARLPRGQGTRRAGGARRRRVRGVPARRPARPRLQLQRPQDRAALRPARSRGRRDRSAPRRHRRELPGGDRPPVGRQDPGLRRRRGPAPCRPRRRRRRQLGPAAPHDRALRGGRPRGLSAAALALHRQRRHGRPRRRPPCGGAVARTISPSTPTPAPRRRRRRGRRGAAGILASARIGS